MRPDEGNVPKLDERNRDEELLRKQNQQEIVLLQKNERKYSVKS